MNENIVLTDDQQKIFDGITHNIKYHNGRFTALIEGWAGTGKSTLVSKLIESLSKYNVLAITSPTHKANSVLKNMLPSNSVSKICTIHSFLGLKLKNEKDRQVLEQDPRSPNANLMVDVLFIDECSMISDSLYEYILSAMSRVRRGVIFIGDSCQLPPVDQEENTNTDKLSPTFENNTYKYQLKTVLRQAMDNPIINLATSIRLAIDTPEVDPLGLITNADEKTKEHVVRLQDDFEFYNLFYEQIKSESSSQLYENVNKNKILSYTNKNVDLANKYIRSELFPDVTDELIEGEPIIFDAVTESCPYAVQDVISCPSIVKETFFGIECWKMRLDNGTFLYVVAYETRHKYELYMQELAFKIYHEEINPVTKSVYTWQDYYLIKNRFASVSYPYAITAHKSQGSTFDNIWFDISSIQSIRDHERKCRVLYTSITRPKNLIIYRI